jgi:succinoglycan biosynthesis protein ExoA
VEAAGAAPAQPFVSIVVPTSNRAGLLRDSLETLLHQRYPSGSYEVVVVDNGSRDDTSLLMRSVVGAAGGPRVRFVSLATADANGARNSGIRAAHGDPICIVDDDVLIPPGWLAALVAAAGRSPDAGCLGGPVRALPDARRHRCAQHPTGGATFDEGAEERPVTEVWGANMAVRRAWLDRVGPFREGLARAQEWEWEQRLLAAGGQIVYVPDAWLWHVGRRRRTLRAAFLRGLMVGRRSVSTPLPRAARYIADALAHGLRFGCRQGAVEAARHSGLAAGILVERLRESLGTKA